MQDSPRKAPWWAYGCGCLLVAIPCVSFAWWVSGITDRVFDDLAEEQAWKAKSEASRQLERRRRERISKAMESVKEYLVHDRWIKIANQLLIVQVREPGFTALSAEKKQELLDATADAWREIVGPTDDPDVWVRFVDENGKSLIEWMPEWARRDPSKPASEW